MLTRRRLILSAAILPAAPLLPRRVWAQTTLTLGAMQIDTLSDGSLTLPGDFILGGMPADEVAAILARHGLQADVLTPPCNITLLRDGTNTVLFDVGSGPDFQPSAGRLAEALEAAGIAAEDVTHVVFTHAHPDHLWGVLDDFDEPVFANAAHMIGQAEFDYWTDPATVDRIGAARTTFAVGAARRLGVLADGLTLLADGQAVLPGITARLTPGHTPGHLSFEIGSGGDRALVIGDAIGNHHVAMAHPDWQSGSDQDPALAAQTRAALVGSVAAEGLVVVGFHLPDGGIGRIEPEGAGFRFAPAGPG
jgi:glyoxylase-like metal-dependent hydrolase (beta-lactamase superfamily II)